MVDVINLKIFKLYINIYERYIIYYTRIKNALLNVLHNIKLYVHTYKKLSKC